GAKGEGGGGKGGMVAALVRIKSGPPPMKPRFWNAHRRICICRCYLLCGPDNDRAICFVCPGPPMTGRIFGYARAKLERAVSSVLARRSKQRWMLHRSAARSCLLTSTASHGHRTASARRGARRVRWLASLASRFTICAERL